MTNAAKPSSSNGRPAVFLDRDNTLIDDPGYLKDPGHVRLLDGAAEATARLRRAGFAVVVVTNQSGVARGLMAESDVAAVNTRMKELLVAGGGGLDAVYYCPYLEGPDALREEYRRDSDLRKPRPGMLQLAARELGLDLARSWMIGDSSRDVEAGRAAGCRTIFIGPGGQAARADIVAPNLMSAADRILAETPPAPAPVSPPPRPENPTPPPPAAPADSATFSAMLEELRIIRRDRQYDDFSIGRLAGAIAQVFAVIAIGWGLYAWVDGRPSPQEAATYATIRLLAGIAFQIMALTCFSAAKRK